jgi:hypothetical protein
MKKIEILLEIKAETTKAYLFSDGVFEEWIPKSQVVLDCDGGRGDTVVVTMADWIAEDKGFI